MTIAIIGLGLIGGSFAKAVKSRTSHKAIGLDRSEKALEMALECGAVDSISEDDIGEADIIIAALYPRDSLEFIHSNINRFKKGAIITDFCGVKRYMTDGIKTLANSAGLTFIGGHPMAGRELSGFENSITTMFDGASMILTPDSDTQADKLETLKSLFLEAGFGDITITTPAHHDEMIAFTSQLAHIVSSAYVQNPAAEGYMGFSAGSFGDMTRVAKLNEDMWSELFLLNGDYLSEQIGVFMDNLAAFKGFIEAGDSAGLRDMLKKGREIKETLNKAREEKQNGHK